jgi:glycosyltransferase involved in cell wall biosynthesis
MRVCFVCEGCYPYVVGGVSGWVHEMIRSFPDIEFVILAIRADRKNRGHFAYELPENLTEVHEVYLQDLDWGVDHRNRMRSRLREKDAMALRSLVLNQKVDWDAVFDVFQENRVSVDGLLMGPDFLKIAQEYYDEVYPEINFSDFLWTMRSIYLPMFLMMKSDLPEADLYHCVATGYAGVLGAMAQKKYHCGLLISEHGIYTREREEELIRAKWVKGIYKDIWISQFRKMSHLAYDRADLVTCLYSHARELQIELGCPPQKIRITPNGVDPERFKNIPGKQPEDEGRINVGAILRVTEIKDVKTLIRAFGFALRKVPQLRLWIMGPVDEEPEYARSCFDMVRQMELKSGHLRTDDEKTSVDPEDADMIFTGRVDVSKYLGRMDFTILTSISEGQPLTILESFAARKPVVATDVGNCRGLICGEEDNYGDAGIVTHIMNPDEIAGAIIELALHPARCHQLGENGYQRMMSRYRLSDMRGRYEEIYRSFCRQQEMPWPGKEEPAKI